MKKTKQDLEELKNQWKLDGCWDIENTPGFEEYREELLMWRREQIKKLLVKDIPTNERIHNDKGSV